MGDAVESRDNQSGDPDRQTNEEYMGQRVEEDDDDVQDADSDGGIDSDDLRETMEDMVAQSGDLDGAINEDDVFWKNELWIALVMYQGLAFRHTCHPIPGPSVYTLRQPGAAFESVISWIASCVTDPLGAKLTCLEIRSGFTLTYSCGREVNLPHANKQDLP